MNQEQFDQLAKPVTPRLVSVDDLVDKTPRTLIYGYYSDGVTHHVYLDEDGQLHRLLYRPTSQQEAGPRKFFIISHDSGPSAGVSCNTDFVPGKRTYPESCDFEFCRLLQSVNVPLRTTRFDAEYEVRRRQQHGDFSGFTHRDGGVVTQNITRIALESDVCLPWGFELRTYPELAARLIVQACREAEVPWFQNEGSNVVLAEQSRAADVMAGVRQLASAINLQDADIKSLAEDLVFQAFGSRHDILIRDWYATGGELVVDVMHATRVLPCPPGAQPYVSKMEGSAMRGVLGSWDKRAYAAVVIDKGGAGSVRLQQFGSRHAPLSHLMENLYGMKPVPALQA